MPISAHHISGTSHLTYSGNLKAGDLYNWLETLPATAVITVTANPGDRPFDKGTTTISASWTTV